MDMDMDWDIEKQEPTHELWISGHMPLYYLCHLSNSTHLIKLRRRNNLRKDDVGRRAALYGIKKPVLSQTVTYAEQEMRRFHSLPTYPSQALARPPDYKSYVSRRQLQEMIYWHSSVSRTRIEC